VIFRFDEKAHIYYGDDVPMPSVTQILKAAGCMGHYKGTKARDRGSAIHEATEVWDTLKIVPDDECKYYVEAWAKFSTDNKIEILASEQQVYNEQLWYAGTLDRIIRINGFIAMLDIKSGSKADWHRLQLAAYALCWPDEINLGMVVYLKPNGRYTTETFTAAHMIAAKNHFKQIRSLIK